MKVNRRWERVNLFIILIGIVSIYITPQTRDLIDQVIFDLVYKNLYVSRKKNLEIILDQYPVVSKKNLPKQFIQYSKLNDAKYQKILKGTRYFLVPKSEVYRKVAGNIRIKDLISHDKYYNRSFYFSNDPLVWGIDKRILFKVLFLQNELEKKGYAPDAFDIDDGHRHPFFNESVGGSSQSRHIRGEAVDMVIGDINQDGKYTDKDKQIVMNICEKSIIKNSGGIGKYPGTRTVHIDVRGHRARWNSY